MAKVKNGILSGVVGTVVCSQLNGVPIVRSRPQRQKGAWTPKQKLHRQRFKEVNSFCKQFKTKLIGPVWSNASEKMSGYHLFLKANMAAFALDGSLVDAHMLQFSTGKLMLPFQFVAKKHPIATQAIEVNWENDPNLGDKRLSDELMILCGDLNVFSEVMATGILRNAQSAIVDLPDLPALAKNVYLFFASKDRKDYSDSKCFDV